MAAQLDELRAQVDEACARARASIEVQHMAVDVEIAALLASLRRLQAQMDERSACTMPMTG